MEKGRERGGKWEEERESENIRKDKEIRECERNSEGWKGKSTEKILISIHFRTPDHSILVQPLLIFLPMITYKHYVFNKNTSLVTIATKLSLTKNLP